GISRKQCPLCFRKYLAGFLQENDTVHLWHTLIRKEKGNPVVADFQPLEEIERPFRGIAAHDAILSAVLRSQIALDRPQDIGIVVDGQQDWLGHHQLSVKGQARESETRDPNKVIRYRKRHSVARLSCATRHLSGCQFLD